MNRSRTKEGAMDRQKKPTKQERQDLMLSARERMEAQARALLDRAEIRNALRRGYPGAAATPSGRKVVA
jgi:hypothetical protein